MSPAPLRILDLGRRPYRPVLELQRALVRARLDGTIPDDVLVLVEHEPVVTLGRGTRDTSLPLPRQRLEARGFTVEAVERGGDVTVHAPGQLVGYPILHLSRHREDVHWYLRQLEEALIRALATLGVPAGRREGYTGAWTGGRKIASIGVHVKRWVTLHGFALNVTTDLSLFDVVVPCGIPDVVMTSVAEEVVGRSDGRTAGRPEGSLWETTLAAVTASFAEVFDLAPVSWAAEQAERMTGALG